MTQALVGQVLREVKGHVWRMDRMGVADGLHDDDAAGQDSDPDAWHLTLFGWDSTLNVDRPVPANRVSRSLMLERQPGTALPLHLRFDRGFMTCGEFVWPSQWGFDEVAATVARQPVPSVRLLHPDVRSARRIARPGKEDRWAIRRGDPPGQWRAGRPPSRFADGVLPAAAFDLLAGQAGWWNDPETHELEFRSPREAESAVRWLEQVLNDTIRDAFKG